MKARQTKYIKSVNLWIIVFILTVLFILPVLFTRIDGEISWKYVYKIWKDQALLIPLFAINHWIFMPKLLLRKRYIGYMLCLSGLITFFTITYYYNDEVIHKRPETRTEKENKRPNPIPPYANLLMYSLLITGVDSGLSFLKRWHENEEKQQQLENENTKMQLDILRNQISPHFFMNTLNNIYALVDADKVKAKDSVMKLSKLMRYILYENEKGVVSLSKEFDFIRSYVELMKIRSEENPNIRLFIPELFPDLMIHPMLFIAYIENAFKYGISYQSESFIHIVFVIENNFLHFNCSNSINRNINDDIKGGLGLKNNEARLKMLYGNRFSLEINETDKIFTVSLSIPLS